VAGLYVAVARNLRVGGTKRQDSAKPVAFSMVSQIAALFRELHKSLRPNVLGQRQLQIGIQSRRFCMIEMCSFDFFVHGGLTLSFAAVRVRLIVKVYIKSLPVYHAPLALSVQARNGDSISPLL
jgi:hypothetical protein